MAVTNLRVSATSGRLAKGHRAGCVRRVTKPLTLRSIRSSRSGAMTTKAEAKFEGSWAKLTPSVTSAAMLGWFLPSSIPVSGLGGNSLTGSFIGSIFSELSHFPTPPAMTSQFWLLCFVWHFGLFLTLTLGQIGWQGKKSGYFK